MGYECNVYVTNDTVATCLAGISNESRTGYKSYIGLVLGTGINSCYIEKLININKIEVSNGKENMLINTESGNYNRQPRGDIDVLFDRSTADPGHNSLEKMISDGYLGALTDHIIRYSKKEQLFSPAFYEAFEKADPLETVDVDAFIRNQDGENKLAEVCRTAKYADDSSKLYQLIQYMIKRAAKLTVLQLAGAAVKCGQAVAKRM